MATRRVLLAALGALAIVAGFVLKGTSDGKLDRLVAIFILIGGVALVAFLASRPSREALARYWQKYEKK